VTSVELEYGINSIVNIKELGLRGRVLSITITAVGIQYEVRYFHDSEHSNAFLYGFELEEPKKVEVKNGN